jgi:hypothetical protein
MLPLPPCTSEWLQIPGQPHSRLVMTHVAITPVCHVITNPSLCWHRPPPCWLTSLSATPPSPQ